MCGQCAEIRPFYSMNKHGKSWNLEHNRQASITKSKVGILLSTLVYSTTMLCPNSGGLITIKFWVWYGNDNHIYLCGTEASLTDNNSMSGNTKTVVVTSHRIK